MGVDDRLRILQNSWQRLSRLPLNLRWTCWFLKERPSILSSTKSHPRNLLSRSSRQQEHPWRFQVMIHAKFVSLVPWSLLAYEEVRLFDVLLELLDMLPISIKSHIYISFRFSLKPSSMSTITEINQWPFFSPFNRHIIDIAWQILVVGVYAGLTIRLRKREAMLDCQIGFLKCRRLVLFELWFLVTR